MVGLKDEKHGDRSQVCPSCRQRRVRVPARAPVHAPRMEEVDGVGRLQKRLDQSHAHAQQLVGCHFRREGMRPAGHYVFRGLPDGHPFHHCGPSGGEGADVAEAGR